MLGCGPAETGSVETVRKAMLGAFRLGFCPVNLFPLKHLDLNHGLVQAT